MNLSASENSLSSRQELSSENLFKNLNSKSFQVLTPAQCIESLSKYKNNHSIDAINLGNQDSDLFLNLNSDLKSQKSSKGRYKPTGAPILFRSNQCSANFLRNEILTAVDLKQKSQRIENFFKKCDAYLRSNNEDSVRALLDETDLEYDVCQHPQIRKIRITLPNGEIKQGFLALKKPYEQGLLKRPFVIFQSGVFSNAGDSGTRKMIAHFFDEAPFNVLTLSSTTGTDYVRDNRFVALGGFDEGMQLIQISKMLTDSNLASFISSIHVTGESLGGHASLFASYLNQFNLNPKTKKPYVTSFLAISPVVNLNESIQSLFNENLKGKVVRHFFINIFEPVFTGINLFQNLFDSLLKTSSPKQVPPLVASEAIKHYSNLSQNSGLSPFLGPQIKSEEDLWSKNNFIQYAQFKFQNETLVLNSYKDWVVPPEPNAIALKNNLNPQLSNNLEVALTQYGNHCAFGPAYGWDIYSSFLNSYIFSNSPELKNAEVIQKIAVPREFLASENKPLRQERYAGVVFEFKANDSDVHVYIRRLASDVDTDGNNCLNFKTENAPYFCILNHEFKVSISSLPNQWAHIPESNSEAEAMTRWMNANVKLVTADLKPLLDQNNPPAFLIWPEYKMK